MAFRPAANTNSLGVFHVMVLEARGMKDKEFFSRQDPYVRARISHGGQVKRTRTKSEAGKNARWHEDLTFNVPMAAEHNMRVSVEVLDENVGRDRLIGQVEIDCTELVNGKKGYDKWFTLRDEKGSVSGELRLDLSYVPHGKIGTTAGASAVTGYNYAQGYGPGVQPPAPAPHQGYNYPPSQQPYYPPAGQPATYGHLPQPAPTYGQLPPPSYGSSGPPSYSNYQQQPPSNYPPPSYGSSGPPSYTFQPPSYGSAGPPSYPGYPPQQPGYPPQQPGYPPQQPGYPPQQQGYPSQQQGYPPQQQGYLPPAQPYGGPPTSGYLPPPGYPPR